MSATVMYKGSTITTVTNETKTLTTGGTWLEGNIIITDSTSGGSITITDEPNSTGTTLVITTSGEPTPSGIPLNTELIDFTEITEDYAIDSSGEAVAAQWYCASDYTAVDASMTFTYTGCTWYYIGVYNSSKEHIRTIYMYTDGTQDPDNSNVSTGTLSGSKIAGASYVRITGVSDGSQYRLSLIRTA